MNRNSIPEKVFLKNFILNQFNIQKAEKLKQEDFDIFSIAPSETHKLAYELVSLEDENRVRIRAYLNINRRDFLTPFILKLKPDFISGNLEDEVFTTTGEIDSAHHLYGGYKFAWLYLEEDNLRKLLTVNDGPFTLVGGGYILLN